MAWENINIGLTTSEYNNPNGGAWETAQFDSGSGIFISNTNIIRTPNNEWSSKIASGWLIGNAQAGLALAQEGTEIKIRGYYNGSYVQSMYWAIDTTYGTGSGYPFVYIFCGVNNATQKGTFSVWLSYRNYPPQSGYSNFLRQCDQSTLCFNNSTLYQILTQNIVIPYHWQSVPSISGKNGILQSLVQIKEEALNDGEPVSEATVLSFDSLGNLNIPSVIDEQMPIDPSDVTSVTATYLIPALENGTYDGIKLLVKKGSIPTSEEDADKVVNLDEPTSILRIDSKSVGNLDEDSHYYFVVKLVDEVGTEATSEPKDIWTSHSEGWTFDYTGQIQEFTAPKTGIYSLETWGAQGGDATDGTLTARGGYGAYAYGEVFLTQGDTLYINVGGQNGYGGGGNPTYIKTLLDSENGIIDSTIDASKIYNNQMNGFSYNLANELYGEKKQNESSHDMLFTTPFRKGTATKILVDIAGQGWYYGGTWSGPAHLDVRLWNQIFSQSQGWASYETYAYAYNEMFNVNSNITFNRQTVEIDLTDLSSTDVFYIGFLIQNATCTVYGIYTVGELEIVNT